MRILFFCLVLAFSSHQLASGQNLFLVAKGGVSSYGSANFGLLGGGDNNWKSGLILGIGGRLRTSDSFALEGLIEYSTHCYNTKHEWDPFPLNEPRNRILEFSAIGRVSFHIIDVAYAGILAGPSVSWHHKDEVIKPYPSYLSVTPGRRNVDFGAVMGLSIDGRVSRRIELTLEGTLRMRFYVTPVVQISVAYAL